MKYDKMSLQEKLELLRKFLREEKIILDEEKTPNEKIKTISEKENGLSKKIVSKKENYIEKIIDKDDFSPLDEKKNSSKTNKEKIDDAIYEKIKDISTIFQFVIRIDKAKLEYIRGLEKVQDMIIDSHIVVLKNDMNKFTFPVLETSFMEHEIEQIREWKNNKVNLLLKDTNNTVFNLFKKVLINDINKIIGNIFKSNTYTIKSITIGREYERHCFFAYIEIINPVEKSKTVKFQTRKPIINNEKVKPYGVHITDLIDIAIKYSLKKEEKNITNPFSTILFKYLAEITYLEDYRNL